MIKPTCREGLDESFIRYRSATRKILDLRAIPQQPMCLCGQDECPDLLEPGPELPTFQSGHESLDVATPHGGDFEGVEVV